MVTYCNAVPGTYEMAGDSTVVERSGRHADFKTGDTVTESNREDGGGGQFEKLWSAHPSRSLIHSPPGALLSLKMVLEKEATFA